MPSDPRSSPARTMQARASWSTASSDRWPPRRGARTERSHAMKRPRPRKRPHPQRSGQPRGRRSTFVAVTVVAVIAAATAFVFLRGAFIPNFGPLTGRWTRLDGTYSLEIRSVAPSGRIDVVYLNPRPINVARAEASREGNALKVFIELQAPGYPGSTYTLTYDPTNDQLAGGYYQAALQQSFDVRFVRVK